MRVGFAIATVRAAAAESWQPRADGLDEEVHADRPSIPPFPSRQGGHREVADLGMTAVTGRGAGDGG